MKQYSWIFALFLHASCFVIHILEKFHEVHLLLLPLLKIGGKHRTVKI